MKAPQSKEQRIDPPCVCGHSREEHRDPKYPASTECFAEDCDCISYEAEEDQGRLIEKERKL
jgi:hypothetical protein